MQSFSLQIILIEKSQPALDCLGLTMKFYPPSSQVQQPRREREHEDHSSLPLCCSQEELSPRGGPLLHLPQTLLRGPPHLLCQEVRHQREHGGVSLKEWKLPRPSQRPECLPLRDSKLQSLFLSAGGQPRPRLENFAQETLQSRAATQTMIQISSSRLS